MDLGVLTYKPTHLSFVGLWNMCVLYYPSRKTSETSVEFFLGTIVNFKAKLQMHPFTVIQVMCQLYGMLDPPGGTYLMLNLLMLHFVVDLV